MVLGVKIRNRNTGLFRTKAGYWNNTGKTYATLGHAKTAILYGWGIPPDILDADFLIISEDGVSTSPCSDYAIEYFTRRINRWHRPGDEETLTEIMNHINNDRREI